MHWSSVDTHLMTGGDKLKRTTQEAEIKCEHLPNEELEMSCSQLAYNDAVKL